MLRYMPSVFLPILHITKETVLSGEPESKEQVKILFCTATVGSPVDKYCRDVQFTYSA